MSDDLFEAAKKAFANAYAPYSNFPVGAALRAKSGAIYAAANVENAAYPLSACAEANAVGALASAGEREIVEILVIGGGPELITPCGGCRQRLNEFARPETPVWLADPEGRREQTTLGALLPRSFGGLHLGAGGHPEKSPTPEPKNMDAASVIQARAPGFRPKIAMILGSGLGALAGAVEDAVIIPYEDLPGFPRPSVEGHRGELRLGQLFGAPCAVMSGRTHFYESGDASKMAPAVRTMKAIGAEILVLTNAAGSLMREVGPGSIAIIEDHINALGSHPLIGPNDDAIGPRFPDLSAVYDTDLRAAFEEAAAQAGVTPGKGVYLATSGPSFETPAEIRAFRALGADLVGMSTVPEAILARHCGLRVLGLSAVTNLAAGMSAGELSHDETLEGAAIAADKMARALEQFLRRSGAQR